MLQTNKKGLKAGPKPRRQHASGGRRASELGCLGTVTAQVVISQN